MTDLHLIGWQWSATLLALIVVATAIVAVVSLILWRKGVSRRTSRYDDRGMDWGFIAAVAAMMCVPIAVGMLIGSGGGHARYFQVFAVHGQVEQVSNRLTDASGELTGGELVVTVAGLDTPLLTSDMRLIRAQGTEADLRCIAIWHHLAADEYRCVLGAALTGEVGSRGA